MDVPPLALVVLLGYGLLIAVSLTIWTAVGVQPGETDSSPTQSTPKAAGEAPVVRQRPSNDEVRGARRRPERKPLEPVPQREMVEANQPVRVVERRRAAAPAAANSGGGAPPAAAKAGGSTPAAAANSGGSTPSAAPEKARERQAAAKPAGEHEEDAFERFLRARPDDFDIR